MGRARAEMPGAAQVFARSRLGPVGRERLPEKRLTVELVEADCWGASNNAS
jgi:hypothetical protein